MLKKITLVCFLFYSLVGFAHTELWLAPSATITGGGTVCQNSTGPTLTFTGSGGVAPYTFTYTVNGGAQQTLTTTTGSSATLIAPTSTSGNFNYQLVAVSDSSNPVQTATVTGSVTVNVLAQPDATMGGTGAGTVFNGTPVFRVCTNATSNFTFTNTSSTTGTNLNYTINWGDGSPNFSGTTWTSQTHSYSVGLWNMTYSITGSNGCSITKNYIVFVGSNPAVALGNPGNTDICSSQTLTFPITGTTNNPDGTIYTVTFNDGSSPQTFNHPPPSSVTHTFTVSSCGTTSSDGSNSFPNSFKANIVATNPCGTSSVSVVPIYVSAEPLADFTVPSNPCIGSQVCLTNTSQGNQVIGTTCSNPNIIWSISPATGYTIVGGGVLGNDFGSTDSSLWLTGSNQLCLNFTVAGVYTITLRTGNRCGVDTEVKTICVGSPITPQFTVNTATGCAPLAVTTTNTTPTSSPCGTPTSVWSVVHTPAYCGTAQPPIPNQTTTNASYSFTVPGTYVITLTTTTSCGSQQTTQTVVVKQPPTVSINTVPNLCGSGSSTFSAQVNSCAPTGETLTYAWSFPGGSPSSSTAQNPGSITYSSPGNYTVSLTVTNSCGTSSVATQSFVVSPAPVITNSTLTETLCSGTATTPIPLTASLAGTTFTWTATGSSGVTGFQSGSGPTIPAQTLNYTGSATGTVTYTVTPSVSGCTGSPVAFTVTVVPAPIFTTQPQSQSVCENGTLNPLNVALSGASGTPTYQWYSNTTNSTSGGTAISGATSATYTPAATPVGTFYYYCSVSFTSGGCSSLTSQVAVITIAPQPQINGQPMASQTICEGSTLSTALQVSVQGGNGTPSYQWYSNTTASTTGGTAISGATTSNYLPPVFTTPGNYYFYVSIALSGSGCTGVTSSLATIIVTPDPSVSSQPLVSQTLCQNAVAQPLSVSVTPAAGTYLYQWYSNLTNSNTGGSLVFGATSATFTPPTVATGTVYYYCEISLSGSSGCGTTSQTAAVVVTPSPTVTLNTPSTTLCLGMAMTPIQAIVANSTGTPNYQWYQNTVNSNSGGIPIAGATASSYTPPAATVGLNYYYCTVSFPALTGPCAQVTTGIHVVDIQPVAAIAPANFIYCSGASITYDPATVSANTVPTGTIYTWGVPVIAPSNALSGATASSSAVSVFAQTLQNLTTSPATATYTLVPQSGSCAGTPFTITLTINPAITPNVVVVDNPCFGVNTASITTNVTGGIPFTTGAPYQYNWTGPNGFSATSASVNNLAPGNYQVTITDAGGCPFSASYTITEPNDIVITLDNEMDVTCFNADNGSILLSINGGTGSYIFNWTRNGSFYSTSEDLVNLSPGTYVVTVTDANNCGPKTATFTITQPPALVVSLVSQTNILCAGAATGTVTVAVAGGTPNALPLDYTYAWTGPNGFTATTRDLTGIVAGAYTLQVTDAQGCVETLTVTLTENPLIQITYTTTPITCYGANDASFAVTISGGVGPYQFVWNNLSTVLNQNNLAAGTYTITVTDALGCVQTTSIVIPEAPLFAVTPVVTPVSCYGAHNGSIQLNLVGGIAPVSLIWSDGSTSGTTRNNLPPGVYTVTITDSKPCQIVRTFIITEPQPLVLSAQVTDALNCTVPNSGAIDLIVNGGTPPYTYQWTNGATTEDLSLLTNGTYAVQVTDSRGCVQQAQYVILRPAPVAVTASSQTTFDCATHVVNQQFVASASGGVPPYTYQWSSGVVSGSQGELMTTQQEGLVTLTAIDAQGCSAQYSVNVDLTTLGYPDFSTTSLGYTTYGIFAMNDPITFTSSITGDYQNVVWDFGDGTFSNDLDPVHTYGSPGSYVVTQTVYYPFGCVYTKVITLWVEQGYFMVLPSAFTPNKDGVNDTYRPVTKRLKNVEMFIYDSWGSLIYAEKGDALVGWDALIKNSPAENGNYYCKVTATTFTNEVIEATQTFVLIK